MTRTLAGIWLGRRPYGAVLELQRALADAKRAGSPRDIVLFLEHEPVITLGSGAKLEHVLLDAAGLKALGVEYAKAGRGGDVTLHAPGQLVCYPILDLAPDRRDVRRYVRDLTETMRRVVADYGISAGTHADHVGLWVDRESPSSFRGPDARAPVKIGAIGVAISRWVTMHGFALNLTVDLDLFRLIVPCGIRELGVSSLLDLGGPAVTPRAAAERALEHLAAALGASSAGLSDADVLETLASSASVPASAMPF
jgi:lipoyl(octanoyl) transferase